MNKKFLAHFKLPSTHALSATRIAIIDDIKLCIRHQKCNSYDSLLINFVFIIYFENLGIVLKLYEYSLRSNHIRQLDGNIMIFYLKDNTAIFHFTKFD